LHGGTEGFFWKLKSCEIISRRSLDKPRGLGVELVPGGQPARTIAGWAPAEADATMESGFFANRSTWEIGSCSILWPELVFAAQNSRQHSLEEWTKWI